MAPKIAPHSKTGCAYASKNRTPLFGFKIKTEVENVGDGKIESLVSQGGAYLAL